MSHWHRLLRVIALAAASSWATISASSASAQQVGIVEAETNDPSVRTEPVATDIVSAPDHYIAEAHPAAVIYNPPGGVIESSEDALRPTNGDSVVNAGKIQALSYPPIIPPHYTYPSAINWQTNAGAVINEATGTIVALRSGILSTAKIDIVNRGLIEGAHAFTAGAGVEVGPGSTVQNWGSIRALGNQLTPSAGITMAGGLIENFAGGVISGRRYGIHIVSGGTATTIHNMGTIYGEYGVRLTGDFDDTITNGGTIEASIFHGVLAIDMGGGDDVLNVLPGAIFVGRIIGGSGIDRISLGGSGEGTFDYANVLEFEHLSIDGGTWSLIGSGFPHPIAVNSVLLLRHQNLSARIVVNNGGALIGAGAVDNLTLASGGTVAPGPASSSPGLATLIVGGNFVQASGSRYIADTTAGGGSDLIQVGGVADIESGAQLTLARDGTPYTVGTRYTLLTAAGGILGSYTVSQTPQAGTEFRLFQSADTILAVVVRTADSLQDVAATRNQAAVARAFGALGAGNTAYATLTEVSDDADVRRGLDLLSGEGHASIRIAAVNDAELIDGAVTERLLAPDAGTALWLRLLGHTGMDDGGDGIARVDRSGLAVLGGIDIVRGTVRFGLAGGYSRTTLDSDARRTHGRVRGTHLLAYAGAPLGPVSLRGSLGYGWMRNSLDRIAAFPGFSERYASAYDGELLHGFLEAGVPLALGGGAVEPFASVAAYRLHVDDFAESAGAAALAGRKRNDHFTFATLGLNARTPLADGIALRSRVGWRHSLGEDRSSAALRFLAGGPDFTVDGTALGRDAMIASFAVAWTVSQRIGITSSYTGVLGGGGESHRLGAALTIAF